MKDFAIKVKSIEHGQKVKQYLLDNFKELEEEIKYYSFAIRGEYYVIHNKTITPVTESFIKEKNIEIIELPEEEKNTLPKRGDRILVWAGDDKIYTFERIFLAYIEGAHFPVITVNENCEEDFKKGCNFHFEAFNNWEPLPKESPLELTIEQIAEKFNVKPELIKIKK